MPRRTGVVRLVGELDLTNAAEVAGTLGDVTVSTGIAVLITARRRILAAGHVSMSAARGDPPACSSRAAWATC